MTREESVTDQEQSREPSPRKRNPFQVATEITIKALLAKGLSVRQAASVLNVSPTTIQRTKDRLRAHGEELPGPRTARRDELAGQVLERFMAVGAKLPAKRIRASDAAAAVKTYAGIAWPQDSAAPASITFTEIRIHEARMDRAPLPTTVEIDVEPGPASTTTARS